VNEAYLSRVINLLVKPIDGRGEIFAYESQGKGRHCAIPFTHTIRVR